MVKQPLEGSQFNLICEQNFNKNDAIFFFYIDNATNTVRTKKVWKLLGQTMSTIYYTLINIYIRTYIYISSDTLLSEFFASVQYIINVRNVYLLVVGIVVIFAEMLDKLLSIALS